MPYTRCARCGLTQALQDSCKRCGSALALATPVLRRAPKSALPSPAAILVRPRQTIRAIVDQDPTRYVILLAWLSGVASAFGTITAKAGDRELPLAFYIGLALYLGPLTGFFHTYTGAALARLTGSWLGGEATFAECRAAMAWGAMPLVCALPLWVIGFSAVGIALIREHAFGIRGTFVILGTQLLIWVWAFTLQVACTAEVHRFSTARALLTAVLGWIVFIGSLIALVLVAMAFIK